MAVDEEFLSSRSKQPEKKDRTREREKKHKKRTEEEKEVFCRLPDSQATLTFSFVSFPSRVESLNTRTTALKKADKTAGEQWL